MTEPGLPPPVLVDQREDGVTIITLNDAARRNALSLPLRLALREVLALAAMHGPAPLILTGAGPGFCAGGDISAMGISPDLSLERFAILQEIARSLAFMPRPVIAAVNGAAFGAGLSLALLSDVIIAAPGAKLGATFGRVGLVPDTGFLWAAGRRLSQARVLRMVMFAEILTAEAALQDGLVDEIAEDCLTHALRLATCLTETAPLANVATRLALAGANGGIDAVLAQEMADQSRMYRSADHLEAVAAFRAKRPPVFSGR